MNKKKVTKASDLNLVGMKCIVKLFPLVQESESGIIMPKLDIVESEGGRAKAVTSKFQFQPRGVVVNVSAEMKEKLGISNGDIIRLNENLINPAFQFFEDCTKSGAFYEGLYIAQESLVIGFEKAS